MQELLSIILAIVLNLIPAEITEFTIQITEGDQGGEVQFKKQEDGGWKPKGGRGIDESSRYYVSGTEITVKADSKTETKDLAKHLTIGATPFKVRHQPDGLSFLVEPEGEDDRVIRVRWKTEKE